MGNEASTKQGGKQGAGVGVAIIIAVAAIWYNNNPRYWLMPDLESGSAMGTVFKALSPDDPATPEVLEGKTLGEPMSDRYLFIRWAKGAAFDRSIPVPLTVGGAIEDERARALKDQKIMADSDQRHAEEYVRSKANNERLWQQIQARQAEAARRGAEEYARSQAEAERHWQEQQPRLKAEQVIVAAKAAQEQACRDEYDAIYDAYIESPSVEGGAAVTEAAGRRQQCLAQLEK